MDINVLIAILKQGRYLNIVSWLIFAFTVWTVIIFLVFPFFLLFIAFLLLIIQNYYAFRIFLDCEFFIFLREDTSSENLQRFDQILSQYGLIKQIKKRTLQSRSYAALRLIKAQILFVCLQVSLYASLLIYLLVLQLFL